eukprot:3192984-Alexandrium_andersonii.AAC.1
MSCRPPSRNAQPTRNHHAPHKRRLKQRREGCVGGWREPGRHCGSHGDCGPQIARFGSRLDRLDRG